MIPLLKVVNAKSLGIGNHSVMAIVRGKMKKVRKGIEQRDAAIKSGALGSLTVLYIAGKFRIPGEGTDAEKTGGTELWNAVRSAQLREGDVVIVAGADELPEAEYGALSAALTLL